MIHDHAHATSTHVMNLICCCLREEEWHDCFLEIYARVKAGMEHLVIEMKQEPIKPSLN